MAVSVLSLDGRHPIYGIPASVKAIVTSIPGALRCRLRFRNNSWAFAFVRTAEGVRKFCIIERPDGCWELDCEQGRNATAREM